MTSAIDRHLTQERRAISMLDAGQADAIRSAGALFVDTRPMAQREQFGEIPGAIVIERNVLEWRLDPTSPHRHPEAARHTGAIVVFCQEGYASSLAVASLVKLGVVDVHDLAGGFEAWAAAGNAIVGGAPEG